MTRLKNYFWLDSRGVMWAQGPGERELIVPPMRDRARIVSETA